ncbi:ABC transporter substrate-binding protein [Butyrivibrio sp. LC3010]|uniref:ABC transporter substrate-binding protein n=1 Tax=Butyrivibrio sp. LC3010 TaxID=1280680 RepID=UPI0004091B0C|nr:ABC transporter substrate-binding protein [Butyrivibrio sp. LC3010]
MKGRRFISSLLAGSVMATTFLSGCGQNSDALDQAAKASAAVTKDNSDEEYGDVDLSEHVTLTMYLYGSESVAGPQVMEKLNEKLTEDMNTSLEIKYIDWGDIATKYPLLWASGEYFDMAYASQEAPVTFNTLATQGSLYDLTDLLDKYAPVLKEKEESAGNMDGITINGSVYGISSLSQGFNTYGFVYNKAYCDEWGIDYVTNLASMEAYCDASVAHGMYPLNSNAELSVLLYRMLVAETGKWVDAPGIPINQMYLVADYDDYENIIHPAFTEEFEKYVKLMDEWEKRGYWPSDILSSTTGGKDQYKNGQTTAYIAHMPDWTGSYGSVHGDLENQDIDAWHPAEDNNKVMVTNPSQDLTVINANSKYPERCMMLIEKLMTDESYYDLFQYGIEGVQFENKEGYLERPEVYNDETDGFGLAAWAFGNSDFTLKQHSEHPARYELKGKWMQNHIKNPYDGFGYDSGNVSAELSAVANVNAELGNQLMLGKTDDVDSALEQYRSQLKSAGIDDIIEDVKTQLSTYIASK